MAEARKLAAILAADVVGYSRLWARTRTARSRGCARCAATSSTRRRGPQRARRQAHGDGALVEFRSVVDAVRARSKFRTRWSNATPACPRIAASIRIGIHLGDVVEESDGDLMGDGVNIAARLEGIAMPGAICLSEDAYRQVRARLDLAVTDLGPTQLKNIASRSGFTRCKSGIPAQKATASANQSRRAGKTWRDPFPTSPRSLCSRSTT